jgi:hypothetical protein
MSPARRSGSALNFLVLLLYLALSLILTYPLLFNLSRAVPNDIGDPLLNTWILAWDSQAWLSQPLRLFDANIFYPLPNTLAFSEHLFSTALLILPLQLALGEPILAYNLSLLLTFPLAAFGMYLLALRWTGRPEAAFLGGLIFAFSPYRFAAMAHLQLLTLHWLPFALLFLDRLLRPPANRPRSQASHRANGLAFALFLLLQLLASWYLALYTGLIIGLYVVVHGSLGRVTGRQLAQLGASLVGVALLTLPLAWPYLSLLDALGQARPLALTLSLAAVPADYLAAAPSNWLFGELTGPFRQRPGFSEENTLFVGLFAPLLALVGLAGLAGRQFRPASRPPSLALLLILLVSLALTWAGPYQFLAGLIPATTIVRVPPRWIIPALFGLAGLAAFGGQLLMVNCQLSINNWPLAIGNYWRRIGFGLAVLVLLVEALSLPLPLAPVENRGSLNPAYHWLARQPRPLALVELPLHSAPAPEFPEVKRLYASTLGWWSLVNGYSGYTPPRQTGLAQALAQFPQPEALAALPPLIRPERPLYLLLHPGEAPLERSRWESSDRWQAERNPALRPVGEFAGDYLYQVMPEDQVRFSGPAVATFGPDQAIQLLQASLDPPAQPAGPVRLRLYWRTNRPLVADATIFIHLRAADGFVLAQADGPPVSGYYPTSTWAPAEIIQDIHPLPALDLSQVDHLALGLYDPAGGQRYAGLDQSGRPLPAEAWLVSLAELGPR